MNPLFHKLLQHQDSLEIGESVLDENLFNGTTLKVIQTVSEQLHDHFVKEANTSIAFSWEINNNLPLLTDLSMGLPYKHLQKQSSDQMFEGFKALCDLKGLNVYPCKDYNHIDSLFNLDGKWVIHCVLVFPKAHNLHYEDHQNFIKKYKKLVPKLASEYRSFRYETRLYGEEAVQSKLESTKMFAYKLGISIASEFNEFYNTERERLVGEGKALLADLCNKHHLSSHLDLSHKSLNHCSFHQQNRGFKVIQTDPLLIHEVSNLIKTNSST